MLQNQLQGTCKTPPTQTVVHSHLDTWLHPTLCLAFGMVNVHMHP
jgi:hypothetical protein